MRFVVALDGSCSRRAAVDGGLLWHTVTADRLGQKPLSGVLVPLFRHQDIAGLALLLDRAREIAPLARALDVRLVHPPADPDGPCAAMHCLVEEGTVFDDPALTRRVVNQHAARFH